MSLWKSGIILLGIIFAGCGGGGGGGDGDGDDGADTGPPVPPPPVTSSGVFLDSAVEGLTYQSGANPPGTTDANGTFVYTVGETLTFSVGGVELGTLPDGDPFITPFNFGGAAAANIARFLQTLDADGDPSNGIDLTAAAAALVNTALGDAVFMSDALTFEIDIAPVLETALGPDAMLVDEVTALAHLVSATASEFDVNELAARGFVAVFPSENEIGVMNFAGSTVETMWRNDTLEAGGDGTTTIENWSVDESGLLILTNPAEQRTVTIEKVGSSPRAISVIATEAPGAEPIIGTLLVPVAVTVGSLAGVSGRTFSFVDDGGTNEATFSPDGTVTSIDDGNLSVQPWEIDSNGILVSVLDVIDPEINLFVLINGSFATGGDVLHIGATNLSGNSTAPILQLDNMFEGSLTPVFATNPNGTISYSFFAGGAGKVVLGFESPAELGELFTDLSVSGTFDYDNSAPLSDVIGGGLLEGASAYEGSISNLAGSVGGMTFSDPSSGIAVGDDNFVSGGPDGQPQLVDILLISADPETGFEIGGFTLVAVHLGWGEGHPSGNPDFLSNQDLPTLLPAFGGGSVQLDFTSAVGDGFVLFGGFTASPAL